MKISFGRKTCLLLELALAGIILYQLLPLLAESPTGYGKDPRNAITNPWREAIWWLLNLDEGTGNRIYSVEVQPNALDGLRRCVERILYGENPIWYHEFAFPRYPSATLEDSSIWFFGKKPGWAVAQMSTHDPPHMVEAFYRNWAKAEKFNVSSHAPNGFHVLSNSILKFDVFINAYEWRGEKLTSFTITQYPAGVRAITTRHPSSTSIFLFGVAQSRHMQWWHILNGEAVSVACSGMANIKICSQVAMKAGTRFFIPTYLDGLSIPWLRAQANTFESHPLLLALLERVVSTSFYYWHSQ